MRRILYNAFRERQVFLRVDDRVRFFRVSSGLQVFVVILLLAGISWSAVATLTMQNRGDELAVQDRRIAVLERDKLRLGGELAATRAYYTNAASEISRQFIELKRLATARGALESRLFAAQAQLGDIESRYRTAQDENNELSTKVAALNERLLLRNAANKLLSERLDETSSALAGATAGRSAADRLRRSHRHELAGLRDNLASSKNVNAAVREQLERQRDELVAISESRDLAQTEILQLNSRIAALNSDLDDAEYENLSLVRRLAATSDALTDTHRNQVEAEQRGNSLAENVSTLERRLNQVRATQLELLQGIRGKARRNIAALQATLAQTGIPLDELLQSALPAKSGLGGPLLPVDEESLAESGGSFESVVGNLELELYQWEGMQDLMTHIPLTRPTVRGYVSSPFGRRRDPISGRRSYHKGVDIAAPIRTSIYSTAAGTVIFAGSKTAYGKIVEIDHGYGFVTKYAHLRSILVKTGERVTFHQKIATMGTTGRSTGSHVHYEVLYQGEQMDPINFFEAGRYVFKVQAAKDPEDEG